MTDLNAITILLISNSKILKNKFIESLSSDLNHFSTMAKSLSVVPPNSRQQQSAATDLSNFQCYVCDYTTETLPENSSEPVYVQLIDANDKALISSLVKKSSELESGNQFYVNGIVYLYDELNTDTFAYINSIHAELNKSYSSFVKSDNLTCLLFNMADGTNIGTGGSVNALRKSQQEEDAYKLTELLDAFLDEFTNVQYVRLESVDEIKELMYQEDEFFGSNKQKLKASFDALVYRYAPVSFSSSAANSRRKESTDHNSNSNFQSNAAEPDRYAKKNSYKGEMARNLRNGKRA